MAVKTAVLSKRAAETGGRGQGGRGREEGGGMGGAHVGAHVSEVQ